MDIQVGKYAGFCMGVQRAVDMVLTLSSQRNGTPVATFGPLIHNAQVMDLLAQKGITTLYEIPAKGSGIAVIRAHGVQPGVKRRLQQAGFEVMDATCPKVAQIQNIIETYSAREYTSIIVGDRNHPEIEGLRGYAADNSHVVGNLEELAALPPFGKAIVVAQSTQNVALYQKVRQWTAEHYPHYLVFDTICDSTERRQAEVVSLAAEVDLLLVVGGRNSGNTRRLYEVASATGKPAISIETAKDLDLLDRRTLASAGRIGITAGASTPDWVVRDVCGKLEKMGKPVAGDPGARGMGSRNIRKVEAELLQGVSRSFALTIPQLPAGLQERVTNAYLLCRIVDTIEDEETLAVEAKKAYFDEFNDLLDKGDAASVQEFADRLLPLLSGGTLPAERELIRQAGLVLQTFFAMTERQRKILARCLRIMSAGMLRFQESKSRPGVPTLAGMNAYCYHVAGVVGEMLTELFSDYSSEIKAVREDLLALAPSFGQGLQMTNILKDVWEDQERGACWLPRDIFLKNGFDLHDLGKSPYTPRFGAGMRELVAITHGHLRNALEYTLLIPKRETGIRKFCLWGIGMAVLTLQNIHRLPQYANAEQIKISRRDVKRIILVSNLWIKNDFMLRKAFRIAGRGLPLQEAKPGSLCSVWRAPDGATLLYQEI